MTGPELIRRAWCRETSSCPDEWSRENPARGQCAVTALILQDLTGGGQLLRAEVNGESHYWLLTEDGVELDMTLCQFGDDPEIGKIEMRARAYVLSFPDTVRRYNLLKQRIAVLCAL